MCSRLLLALALTACAEAPAEDFSTRAAEASSPDFAIADDPVVAARYAKLAESDAGRRFTERALEQRESMRFIEAAIAARGLPPQLEAVAFVESGFANIPADPARSPSAGVWQFIPETARSYGLRVDAEVDERLDPAASTEAALDLLADLRAELGDWPAAIAAYNVGPRRVRQAMEEQGTTDVWRLIERGVLPTYAADVMAAAAVLED